MEVRRAQPLWGTDFNWYAEVCRCCGLVLLPSGSKFSCWFCGPCDAAVWALNQSAGRCVIPVGRHSFMNGIFGNGAQLRTEVAAIAFADQLMTFFGSMNGVETWASTILQRNLTMLGFDTNRDTQLAEYLDAVEKSSLSSAAAFEAMVSTAKSQST